MSARLSHQANRKRDATNVNHGVRGTPPSPLSASVASRGQKKCHVMQCSILIEQTALQHAMNTSDTGNEYTVTKETYHTVSLL